MPLRLGDGDATKSDFLGGGEIENPDLTTGRRGNLFLGVRRHEQRLLSAAAVARPSPILGPGESPGGGEDGGAGDDGGIGGEGSGNSGGDNGADGGD